MTLNTVFQQTPQEPDYWSYQLPARGRSVTSPVALGLNSGITFTTRTDSRSSSMSRQDFTASHPVTKQEVLETLAW